MTGRPGPLDPEALRDLAASAGVAIPEEAARRLSIHAWEMLRWNRAVRLTAVEDPLAVAVKHVIDSLFLLSFGPFPGTTLDLGSGAGYPGIPLAACAPESRVVLLESSAKKCAFLTHVAALLGLSNVEVVRGRLDKRGALPAGPFDHAVARAVGPPEEVEALLRRCVVPGGRILLLTGPGTEHGGRPAARDSGAERPRQEGAGPAPAEGAPPPAGVRRRWFSLPHGMGVRVIREIRLPAT